jgi:hypothetical protein
MGGMGIMKRVKNNGTNGTTSPYPLLSFAILAKQFEVEQC